MSKVFFSKSLSRIPQLFSGFFFITDSIFIWFWPQESLEDEEACLSKWKESEQEMKFWSFPPFLPSWLLFSGKLLRRVNHCVMMICPQDVWVALEKACERNLTDERKQPDQETWSRKHVLQSSCFVYPPLVKTCERIWPKLYWVKHWVSQRHDDVDRLSRLRVSCQRVKASLDS